MKAGTTSLHRFLCDHPDVRGPATKELHYFSIGRARWGLPGYLRHFRGAGASTVRCEASPSYSEHPTFGDVPRRIRSLLPDVRLIYLLRDPATRMRSHWRHELLEGRSSHRAGWDERFVGPSCYGDQLTRYLRYFEPEQIALVDAEHLREDRTGALEQLFGFLGVDPTVAPTVERDDENVSSERTPISPLAASLKRSAPISAAIRHLPAPVRATGRRMASDPTAAVPDVSTVDPPPIPPELQERLAADLAVLTEVATGCVTVSSRPLGDWWAPAEADAADQPAAGTS
jgi:hypothetical protein